MIRRVLGLAALAWLTGFALFMLTLPGAAPETTTDAVVVPTGGAGRIDRGLELLDRHLAHRLLVTGVGPNVTAAALAKEYAPFANQFGCCVDLGNQAVDTRSNAEETARWVRARGFHTLRLVTSDWHMPRARMELAAALGPDVVIVPDAVSGERPLGALISEYNKLLVRRVALWLGR